MLDLTLAQAIELIKDAQSKSEGIWVRLHTDLKICLIEVQDENVGIFTAKFFPCARNSRRYTIPFGNIRELEKTESGETPFRFTSAEYYSPQSGE
jgi:hypothetical protein